MSLRKSEGFLTRSGLRDAVIVLSAVSALFCAVSAPDVGIAFLLLCLGSFIHFVVKGVLIRNEVLCAEGIYRLARHPYYLANYLVDSSFCLLSGNRWLLLLYPFLFFWSYGPTLRQEEATLTEKHGRLSVAYLLNTPPVFPDRRSIRYAPRLFAGFSFARLSRKEAARITRFYATALLIMAFHQAAGKIAARDFFSDRATLMLLVPALFLYAVAFIILKCRKRAGSN